MASEKCKKRDWPEWCGGIKKTGADRKLVTGTSSWRVASGGVVAPKLLRATRSQAEPIRMVVLWSQILSMSKPFSDNTTHQNPICFQKISHQNPSFPQNFLHTIGLLARKMVEMDFSDG